MELGSLIKIISHDLRGPLGNFKNITSLFRSGELDLDQVKMLMEHVEVGVDRSLKLLDELIEWTYASSTEQKGSQDQANLNEIVKEVKSQLQEQLSKKEITFLFQERDLPLVKFNAAALKVILKNLLTNAIHFTKSGGVISVEIAEEGKEFIVSVVDNGIGIPEKMLGSIFEMGKDNRRLGTDNEKGTGIGLFICKDLTTRNDSKVWLDATEVNGGSVFKFTVKKGLSTEEHAERAT